MITLESSMHKLLGKHTVRLSAMPHLQQAKTLQRSSSKTTLQRVRNVFFTPSHVRDQTVYAPALGLFHCGALLTNHFNTAFFFSTENPAGALDVANRFRLNILEHF